MKLGIVGLPNVGKSTLFNAITSTKNAEAANYPFCTIEPNSGIVAVPDKRLDKLAEVWQTNKKTPAIVEFVDIAGLVKGASQGAGLGNKFLGHIRECDAIVHVVRCFDDDNIIHVVEDVTKAEAVDPIADIDAIDYELILSDLEVVQNRAGRMAKAAKSGNNKGAAAEAAWLQKLADHLSTGKPARSFDFDENDTEQQTVLHEMGLLSARAPRLRRLPVRSTATSSAASSVPASSATRIWKPTTSITPPSRPKVCSVPRAKSMLSTTAM